MLTRRAFLGVLLAAPAIVDSKGLYRGVTGILLPEPAVATAIGVDYEGGFLSVSCMQLDANGVMTVTDEAIHIPEWEAEHLWADRNGLLRRPHPEREFEQRQKDPIHYSARRIGGTVYGYSTDGRSATRTVETVREGRRPAGIVNRFEVDGDETILRL